MESDHTFIAENIFLTLPYIGVLKYGMQAQLSVQPLHKQLHLIWTL